MKIGIIVAMGKELALLRPLIANETETERLGYRFYSGLLGGHEVVVMQCGIGKVNAAVGAQKMIDIFAPELIINTGVAGGTGRGAAVADVVVATGVGYHDVWCGPGTVWGEAAGCPRLLPVDSRLVEVDIPGVKRGVIASGDIFVSRPEEVEHILSVFPEAMAVDMESGAIAQVCFLNGVPFGAVRVMSDTPGAADNISQYENFWEDAPRHTFEALTALLNAL